MSDRKKRAYNHHDYADHVRQNAKRERGRRNNENEQLKLAEIQAIAEYRDMYNGR